MLFAFPFPAKVWHALPHWPGPRARGCSSLRPAEPGSAARGQGAASQAAGVCGLLPLPRGFPASTQTHVHTRIQELLSAPGLH